jgi:chromosome segregation ATPase
MSKSVREQVATCLDECGYVSIGFKKSHDNLRKMVEANRELFAAAEENAAEVSAVTKERDELRRLLEECETLLGGWAELYDDNESRAAVDRARAALQPGDDA